MGKARLKHTFYHIYGILAVLILFVVYIEPHKLTIPKFLVINSPSVDVKNLEITESSLIPEPSFLLASHSPSFTVLNNGSLRAFWFAGSHEGKPDVKIWSSLFNESTSEWSMATPVISPEMLSNSLGFFSKKVGNPVVYRDQHNVLHLFVVSVGGIGGWAASNINHLYSFDEGKTWLNAKRLILSPFFNISTLNRTLPIALTDGGFYLPVYHEMIHKYPELLRFDANGDFVSQIRMSGVNDLLQPALVALNTNKAYSFLRHAAKGNDILYMQTTENGGESWSKLIATNLQNHDSSIAVAKLNESTIVMAHNIGNDRSVLVLDISHDGVTWARLMTLEDTPHMEFSYPVIIAHDAVIDVLYTWERKRIKHVRLTFK